MARTEQAIFTVMIMVSNDRGQILVQDRVDPDWPGICFPGGHVEPGEPFTTAAIRETWEETGLTIQNPKLCGIKQFQTKDGARYVVFFYKATQFTGMLTDSCEGRVFWIFQEDLKKYPLVDDFEKMVQVFESEDVNEFFYGLENGSWSVKFF